MFEPIFRAFGMAGALACASLAPLAHAAPTVAQQLHASAAWSFQHGRYAEAYGRFMALADAGHAPAAEVALFMYANGRTLFGSDWDVSPDQLAAWAGLLGRPVPLMVAEVSSHPLHAPTSRPH